MNTQTFFETIKNSPRPVVVDLWAPWCGPCKVVKPILEKLAREYAGRVDLWQINSDDSQDLLRELKVYGIPTLIVYRDGQETLRQVGAKSASSLKDLFEALSVGALPTPAGLSSRERYFRMGLGLTVVAVGVAASFNWVLLVLGAVLMFTAIYDRCPIWRALTDQFKKLTGGA